LKAIAYDADGGSTSSAIVNITVNAANQPPTVALTAPGNGATYTAPATVTLTASASDPENRLTKVEFYQGTSLLNSDTTAPYTFTWSSVPAGSYALEAIAYDADGGSTTSAIVNITVGAAYTGPTTVVFGASADHSSVTSYVLDVFASGADPNTATPIASSDLGKPTPDPNGDISVDRTTFFSQLAAGTYQATVSAVNDTGRGRGAPVNFTR
jgi:hypothetical protein